MPNENWVTTREAAKIKKVGLSQHRIAALANQGKIVAKRAGIKKWLIKVKLVDNKYELVYTQRNETQNGDLASHKNADPLVVEVQRENNQPTIEESLLQIVSISTEPISETGSDAVFLTVENASDKPIAKVYGKIINSKAMPDDNGRYSPTEPIIPKQTNLAWRSGEFAETISAKRTRDIIIAEKLYEYPGFDIFFETKDGRKQANMLATIVLDIEIGSEAADVKPQIVQIKLFRIVGRLEGEILTEPNEKQWKLNLVKLLHDGQDTIAELKSAQVSDSKVNTALVVSAEARFGSWLDNVTKALMGTKLKKLWYNYEVVDPYKDRLSDYISKAERALERLESIVRSASPETLSKEIPLEGQPDRPSQEIVIEAQRRHLVKVAERISGFSNYFKEIDLRRWEYYVDIHPIDEVLRSHLADNSFWQQVESFKDKSEAANHLHQELYSEIKGKAESEIGTLDDLDSGGIHITSNFLIYVIELAVNYCLGQPDDYHRYEWISSVSKQAYGGNFISVGIQSETQHRKFVKVYSKDRRCKQLALIVKIYPN